MKRILVEETVNKIGEEVILYGWVNTRRDHGKIIFIDLRDRTGIVQTVYVGKNPDINDEDVIRIEGIVKMRPEKMVNSKIPTGKIEIEIKNLKILSKSKELPFPLDGEGYDIEEELRLKYRYLDLRRKRLNKNIRLRSDLVRIAREFLHENDFVEIETPLLTKSTPEGSRDFLVPSRLSSGQFYALPQSPQQYKQLLMVAGFERYYQIARCLRDEDLRADRGFEHTQIDIEMSFVEREDVMNILEGLITCIFEKLGLKIKEKPFPRFTYGQAMTKFKSDKFDLRSQKEKDQGLLSFAWVVDFPFFEKDKDGKWTFTHNPFSNPKDEFLEDLLNKRNIANILTTQYDLVCNGFEVGGGSIRSNDSRVLESVFEIMGYPREKIWKQFGHMLDAFSYGAPPHGGCAFGIERLMMIAVNEKYLREVVAFPMTSGGRTSVMDAPDNVDPAQLEELGIRIVSSVKKDVFTQITDILKKNKIEYRVFEHAPVFTSEEAGKVRNTPLKQGAKAMVMIGNKKPLMIVLPADRRIDLKKFKSGNKLQTLEFASPSSVEKITGIAVGAVPPFGSIFQMPLYIDSRIFDNKEIFFNAGLHTKSIEMKSSDYNKIAGGQIGDFSK